MIRAEALHEQRFLAGMNDGSYLRVESSAHSFSFKDRTALRFDNPYRFTGQFGSGCYHDGILAVVGREGRSAARPCPKRPSVSQGYRYGLLSPQPV
ncbi:hypothetical protein FRAHR75_350079 [Frankia sp. Hr75.2]|nr:hypothetical protein FRAHR75_350079 [Frankia sp. Hr75.2]